MRLMKRAFISISVHIMMHIVPHFQILIITILHKTAQKDFGPYTIEYSLGFVQNKYTSMSQTQWELIN